LFSWQTDKIFHITKPLKAYSQKWPNFDGYKMSQWWFEEVSFEDLVDIIIESLNRRDKDRVQNKISVYDRGWRMFKAVCVATQLMRARISLEEAKEFVDRKFANGLDYAPEETEFLLEPDNEYFSGVSHLIDLFRPRKDPNLPERVYQRYARYQQNLAVAMNVYFNDFQVHRIRVCEPILDIQNKLRTIISQLYGVELPPLGENIELAVGFGGFSEVGKSSFAEFLRRNYGFLRLKLRYFIRIIEFHGLERTPERVVLELLHFLDCHPYVQRISFESLHDPYIPALMKLMFGERCKIIFLEAREDVRINRGAKELGVNLDEAAKIITRKDQIKRERGAEVVRDIADIVFDNSAETLSQNLQKFTKMLNL